MNILRGEWTKQLVTGTLIGTMGFWSTIGFAQQFGTTIWVEQGDLEKPSWWQDRGVLDDDPAANKSLVNTGQLKWITHQLHQELSTLLPEQANLFPLSTINPNDPESFEATQPYEAGYDGWKEGNKAVVTLGQIKNCALKFYNELNTISPEWVLDQLQSSGLTIAGTHYWQVTGDANYTEGGYYPWNPVTPKADNKIPANIGQLKSVFSLRLRESKDDDLLPDIFEHALIKYHPDFVNETLDSITWNPGDVQISIKEYDDVTGDVTGTRRVKNSAVPNIGGVSQGQLSVGGLLAQHEPVGSLSGALNVGGDGSASYTIPIKLPRGAGGLTPDLAIQYSSNGGNGLLGLGMDISGFQTITRGRPHRRKDGYIPSEYKPLFSEQDRYYLNGEILVGIEKDGVALTRSPEDGAKYVKGTGVLYKTEKEGFDRILGHGTKGTWGPLYFTAQSKNGQIMEYGNCSTSCVSDPTGMGIHSWYLNKVKDVSGNYYEIEYERDVINESVTAYEASDFRPKRIKFTANDNAGSGYHHEVVFHYEDRPDRRFSYIGGIKMHQAKRLKSIDINYIGLGNKRTIWSYDFRYKVSKQTGRSLLEEVSQRISGVTESPTTVIKWNEADVEWGTKAAMWKEEASWDLPQLYAARNDKSDDNGWRFVDVNSDGFLDLIRAEARSGNGESVGGVRSVLFNHGDKFDAVGPLDNDASWSIPDNVWTSVNIRDDLDNALLATSNPLAKMGDFNGDGYLDFIGKDTDNTEDTDWNIRGRYYESWIRMQFPVYTRDLSLDDWAESYLEAIPKPLRVARDML